MRMDILPLCDRHYRTMELVLAPYSADYSVDFFRCTEKFCGRCFGERVGYATPKRNDPPEVSPAQPRCEMHGRPMFIVGLCSIGWVKRKSRSIVRLSLSSTMSAEGRRTRKCAGAYVPDKSERVPVSRVIAMRFDMVCDSRQ